MSVTPPIIHMNIAELVAAEEPTIIGTILGSCVSVCLFSPRTKKGGMIHYALAEEKKHLADIQQQLRYGNYAIPLLVQTLIDITGESPEKFQAKIVGGSDNKSNRMAIGFQNIQIARKMLAGYGIPIIGESVGGVPGRKILFHTHTGRLQVATLGETRIPDPKEIARAVEKAFQPAPIAPVAKKQSEAVKPASTVHRKIKVLIIDDSQTIRNLLTRVLQEDTRFTVVGSAENPIVAEKMISTLKPDVLTLDIHMPEMSGIQFLEKFMPVNPMPVVMISSIGMKEGGDVLRALELGAVDYIQKPTLAELPGQVGVIREKVFTAASVKIRKKNKSIVSKVSYSGDVKATGMIIAIGASTGGTEALKEVLIRLPSEIPPIVIVQHIPPVFSTAFAKRLNDLCPFTVKEAADGDAVVPNQVLIAPGDFQMEMVKAGSGYKVRVFDGERVNRHKPSVDVLFDSVAKLVGKKAVGAILTGMGADGAQGMLRMKQAGARTIAQDEATCVVFGMPKEAIRLGGVDVICPLDDVAAQILKSLSKKQAA